MSLPNILVHIHKETGGQAMSLAAHVSRLLDASTTALVVRPTAESVAAADAMAPVATTQIVLANDEADAEAALKIAQNELADWRGVGEATLVAETGEVTETVAKHARVHGLTVIGAKEDGVEDVAGLEACLFGSGRPVLVAPPKAPDRIGERIAILWNDSPESANAVWAAFPLLAHADAVTAFAVDGALDAHAALARLQKSMHRAGVSIDARALPEADDSTEERLLRAVKAFKADLIVMGAYGHSQLRELLFGGVTKTMLDNTDRPTVFMAH